MCKTTLKENINDFIEERINESYTNLNKQGKYKKIKDSYYNAFENIINKLKDEELWEEYEKQEIDMYDMQIQEAYKTGFTDCIAVLSTKETL